MMKEPEIKLFGRKIILPENGGECSAESEEESDGGADCDRCSDVSGVKEGEGDGGKSDRGEKMENGDEIQVAAELCKTISEDKNPDTAEESQTTNSSSELYETSKTPSNDDDIASENHPKSETDATNGQQKPLKKPDKILPCPRCNSMDTKFCYYNNYNVNQPRHFCRSCQRYWTAGGTMRNVPVGAGRRKNKNSILHCQHITISEALQAARGDTPNGFHHLKFKPNGTVLSFGPNSPICESMPPAVNPTEKPASVSCKNGEKIDDGSVRPSVMMTNPAPCVPWPFPWNSPVVYPGYPLPYCPAPYFNYGWNIPWLSIPSPLGKHPRDGELLPNTTESSIVVPKTLRIDDPEEAAKSSIWDTLGIKYDSFNRKGLFKAFQPKEDEKKQTSPTTASPLLQANPAALSRSISFQETA